MKMKVEKNTARILYNFGPVNGGKVITQNVHICSAQTEEEKTEEEEEDEKEEVKEVEEVEHAVEERIVERNAVAEIPAHSNPPTAEAVAEIPDATEVPLESRGCEVSGKAVANINQTLMFFEAALNTSFDSHHINQSALAELISFLTGKKKGSIRTKITEGIGYDGPQEKQDAAYLAKLLDDVSPELAQRIRNNIR